MAKHLMYFQQAGLTSLEVKFEEWKWEEELNVLNFEDVGLGILFCNIKKRKF